MGPLKIIAVAQSAAWMLTPVKIPFTLTVLVALIATAIWTNTHRALLTPDDLSHWGYAPQHFSALQSWRIVTSLFVTAGGWRFYVALIAISLFLGCLEWRIGSLRAALLFFGIHALTLFCEAALIVPMMRYFQHPLGDLLHLTHDVGPSAGYYGCLGAILFIDRWSPALISIVALFLLVRVVVSLLTAGTAPGALSADVAHLIALSLGLVAGRFFTT